MTELFKGYELTSKRIVGIGLLLFALTIYPQILIMAFLLLMLYIIVKYILPIYTKQNKNISNTTDSTFCSECGIENNISNKYCIDCGNKL